jgi:protein-tyrosine phosphatase
MIDVLFVCTGNVCRSPFAAMLMNSRMNSSRVTARSAGIQALYGAPLTVPMQRRLQERGVADLPPHAARPLGDADIAEADLILTMTRSQRRSVVERVPSRLRRVFTLREFARLASGLDDEALAALSDPGPGTAETRLVAALDAVSAQRGLARPHDGNDDDVIDPYERPETVYDLSVSQMTPAVEGTIRILRAVVM